MKTTDPLVVSSIIVNATCFATSVFIPYRFRSPTDAVLKYGPTKPWLCCPEYYPETFPRHVLPSVALRLTQAFSPGSTMILQSENLARLANLHLSIVPGASAPHRYYLTTRPRRHRDREKRLKPVNRPPLCTIRSLVVVLHITTASLMYPRTPQCSPHETCKDQR